MTQAKLTAKSEFIGCDVEVADSANKNIIRMKGVVVDETLATFKVLSEQNIRVLLKKASTFAFEKNGLKTTIKGTELMFRPEDRIKKAN